MGKIMRPKCVRLPDKLLQIRLSLNLSQNEMLRHLGLADKTFRSTISGYERGEREPPLPILLQYAKAAGVCVDVLIDDELNLPFRLPGTPQHKGFIST